MFNPSSDLTAIQSILISDASILSLLNLTGETELNITKGIIKRNKWTDLVERERKLCIYFRPSRGMRNQNFTHEIIQVDCHVPAKEDYIAYQVQERAKLLIHEKKINNRYVYFDGQLGELPTMPDFFCAGSRYFFYRKI